MTTRTIAWIVGLLIVVPIVIALLLFIWLTMPA